MSEALPQNGNIINNGNSPANVNGTNNSTNQGQRQTPIAAVDAVADPDRDWILPVLAPVCPLLRRNRRRLCRGNVTAIKADDMHIVKAGQQLVALDAVDGKLALAQAVRQTRQIFLNNNMLAANVTAAETNLAHAQDAVKNANAALEQSRASLAANSALTDHIRVTEHPNVLQAAAQVRNAYFNYARVNIVAPVSGLVSKRSVQLGQRIAAGSPLMAIVLLEQI